MKSPSNIESRFTLTVLVFLVAMTLFTTSFMLVEAKRTQSQLNEMRVLLQQAR